MSSADPVTDPVTDRVPPQSIPAERAVLSSILRDNHRMADVVPILSSPDAFSRQAHRFIYQVFLDRWDANEETDVVLLHHTLKNRGQLEEVGGDAYIGDLLCATATSHNAEYYAHAVLECWRRRTTIYACADATTASFDGEDPDETAAKLTETLANAATQDSDAHQSVGDILTEAFDNLPDAEHPAEPGMDTGIPRLDDLTGGLHGQDVIVLAGCTSVGKSALAIQIAEYVSKTRPVVYFSLEMSRQQVAHRVCSLLSGIPAAKWRRQQFTRDEVARLAKTNSEIAGRPFDVVDKPTINAQDVRAYTQTASGRGLPGLVVVDYLQLLAMSQARNQSREQVVSNASRGMKALARATNCAVLVLSQLNREVDRRDDRRPRLSDLRESGSIEQDADIVLLLHRPESKMGKECELIVAKNRHGPTAPLDLWKNGGHERAAIWLGFDWTTMHFNSNAADAARYE